MKLTDEQLSRVLTAHELGELETGELGGRPAYPACLIQVSHLVWSTDEMNQGQFGAALDFDGYYDGGWTVDEFLAQLEARGLA